MQETNPGRLGEKHERYLCAVPSPLVRYVNVWFSSYILNPARLAESHFLVKSWLFGKFFCDEAATFVTRSDDYVDNKTINWKWQILLNELINKNFEERKKLERRRWDFGKVFGALMVIQTKSSLAVQSGLSNSFAILRCRVELHLVPGLFSSFYLSTWVTLRKVPGRDSTRPIFLWKKLMPVFAA